MTRWMPELIAFILLCTLTGCVESPRVTGPPNPPLTVEATTSSRPDETLLSERIETACDELGRPLLARLAVEKKLAVLPLVDSDGGQRRLGALIADQITAQFVERGRSVVDRTHLNKLLSEIDLQLALTADPNTLQRAGQISGADVLIVGRTTDTGREVLLSMRAIDVTGRAGVVLGATGNVSLPREKLGRLMWYVRRPHAPNATGELPPLAVRCELISPSGKGDVRLDHGTTVRSGQKFKIRIHPNSDCWVYVLLYDTQGAASVLFPHEQIGLSNRVRGGVSYEFPIAAKWYWFDDKPGTETFYLVASYTPLKNLDRILAEMQQAGERDARLATAARKEIDTVIVRGMVPSGGPDYQPKGYRIAARTVGGVVDVGWGSPMPGGADKPDNVVEGYATVVKKLTLEHR